MKIFTFVIPTYNRKERLIQMLKSIEEQGLYDYYNVSIVDNCSSYSIEDSLKGSLSEDFLKIVTVYHNKSNIGLLGQLSHYHNFSETKWVWFLGDDDILCDGGISLVLNDIKENPDCYLLKYTSVYGRQENPMSVNVFTPQQFIAEYDKGTFTSSHWIFISNHVINKELLAPYFSKGFEFVYTYFAHVLPPIFKLIECNKKHYMRFSNASVVTTKPADGDHWSFYKVALGARIFNDMNLSVDKKVKGKLLTINCAYISHRHFAYECLELNPRYYGKYVYSTVYKSLYAQRFFRDKIIKLLFYSDFYLHTSLVKKLLAYAEKTGFTRE